MRPIKRAVYPRDYAAELHSINKIGKHDLHLHNLIEANNIANLKICLLYFLGDCGIA